MIAPNPTAFNLFGIDVKWYGILIACAILIAILITSKRAPKHGLTTDIILDILIIAIPSGIIGARLYYIIFDWNYYSSAILQILNFRGGGLAIHGGLIGGVLGGFFVCHHKHISFLDTLDLIIPSIALAQSIGRWGNFFNQEAHGSPTNLPWAITVMGEKVHPTFLYESIWCFALFFILIAVDNRRKFVGQVSCLYGILYSAERFFVEALRTDSLMIGPFKQAQVISLILIILCAALYIWLHKKTKEN